MRGFARSVLSRARITPLTLDPTWARADMWNLQRANPGGPFVDRAEPTDRMLVKRLAEAGQRAREERGRALAEGDRQEPKISYAAHLGMAAVAVRVEESPQ